jgi:hypothetical protein
MMFAAAGYDQTPNPPGSQWRGWVGGILVIASIFGMLAVLTYYCGPGD